MELGRITVQQLPLFKSLLLPETAAAIERGYSIAAIGLTEEKTACGAAAGYIENGRFALISLYVAPDYRRKGGARLMMEKLKKLLIDVPDVWRIETRFFVSEPEHETIVPFLEASGFIKELVGEENLFFATLSDAANSVFFQTENASGLEVLPFSEIPDVYLSRADRKSRLDDTPMPELQLQSPQMEREVSCAVVRDGTVQAFVSFDRSCGGRLTLSSAWSGIGHGALSAMLRKAFMRASEIYPPETPLAIQAVTPASARLIRALLPNAYPVSFTYSYTINRL